MTLVKIGILLSIMFVSGVVANGLVYKWGFMSKLRDSFLLLRRKPFSCSPCLSFWLNLFTLICVFPNYGILNVISSFALYQIMKLLQN